MDERRLKDIARVVWEYAVSKTPTAVAHFDAGWDARFTTQPDSGAAEIASLIADCQRGNFTPLSLILEQLRDTGPVATSDEPDCPHSPDALHVWVRRRDGKACAYCAARQFGSSELTQEELARLRAAEASILPPDLL